MPVIGYCVTLGLSKRIDNMYRIGLVLAALYLPGCGGDETVAAYGGAGRAWTLVELDGRRVGPGITLSFPETGKIAGQAPCNSYSASMQAPYPWFETGPIRRTRLTCAIQPLEDQYLEALADMTQSEVSGTTLLLRNDAGREMVFMASRTQ